MSDMKKVLLYAIIPAIIAGLFALIPKIYDEMNEPKAILEYTIFQGPLLKVGEEYKSIVSIEVENAGKKVLSNVIAAIKSTAIFESVNLSSLTGLEPILTKSDIVKIDVNKMHPSDKFTVSLMLSSKSSFVSPIIALRSDEVIGSSKYMKRDNSKKVSFFSSLLSGFSVFIMSIAFIVKSKFGTSLSNMTDKQNTLYYISAKLGFKEIVHSFVGSGGNITYLRFSDMLFYIAQHDKSKKKDAIKGLKCLLLVSEIASSSRKHIERNIKVLEDNIFDQTQIDELKIKSKSIKSSLDLRNKIDEYVDTIDLF